MFLQGQSAMKYLLSIESSTSTAENMSLDLVLQMTRKTPNMYSEMYGQVWEPFANNFQKTSSTNEINKYTITNHSGEAKRFRLVKDRSEGAGDAQTST